MEWVKKQPQSIVNHRIRNFYQSSFTSRLFGFIDDMEIYLIKCSNNDLMSSVYTHIESRIGSSVGCSENTVQDFYNFLSKKTNCFVVDALNLNIISID